MKSYILSAVNAALKVTNLFGSIHSVDTIEGLPIGTTNGSATGELAVKVLVIGGTGLSGGSSGLPYGADTLQVVTSDGSGNPLTITYRTGGLSGTIVKTRTLTYTAGNVTTLTDS